MNLFCISGTVDQRPKPLGQAGKSVLCYLTATVMAWDANSRSMYPEKKVFEIVCFGNSLKTIRNVHSGNFITIQGHLDVRENTSNDGRVFKNLQIVADEVTIVGSLEYDGGGGFADGDNIDEPPPRDDGSRGGGWSGGNVNKNDDYAREFGGNGPDDDIPF